MSRDAYIRYVVTSPPLSHMRLNKFGPYSFYFPFLVDKLGSFSPMLRNIIYFVEAMALVIFFNFVMLLSDDHRGEYLAKFGNIQDMKVQKPSAYFHVVGSCSCGNSFLTIIFLKK